jgi:crotonobetainyl-CoA:carnitine CoA-transferase CaiB-like acyl-CoA transferase
MDPMLQAFTGFMSENKGADGIPHRTPVIFFDMSTALYAQQAVAAALYARRDHDKGRKIELSLMEAAASVQAVRLLSGYREGPFKIAAAPSGTFKTRDGWLQIIVVKDREFQKFCDALDLPEFGGDARFQTPAGRREHVDFINGKIRDLLATDTTAHWQALLTEAGLQNEAVQTYTEFAEHPQTKAIEAVAWLRQAGSKEPWPVPNIPGMPKYVEGEALAISPTTGQHTRAIMMDMGYDEAAVDQFLKDGVIA